LQKGKVPWGKECSQGKKNREQDLPKVGGGEQAENSAKNQKDARGKKTNLVGGPASGSPTSVTDCHVKLKRRLKVSRTDTAKGGGKGVVAKRSSLSQKKCAVLQKNKVGEIDRAAFSKEKNKGVLKKGESHRRKW